MEKPKRPIFKGDPLDVKLRMRYHSRLEEYATALEKYTIFKENENKAYVADLKYLRKVLHIHAITY